MLKQSVRGLMAVATLSVYACGGSSGGGASATPDKIDPATEPSAVMQSLGIKIGANAAVLKPGNPPAKTNDPNDPVVSTSTQALTVSPGGSRQLSLSVDSDSPISALFAKVVGADSFAEINFPSQAKAVSDLLTDIELPANIGNGEFCVEFSVANNALLASSPVTVCFVVETSVLDSLQGEWSFACSGGVSDGGDPESFSGFIVVSGNDVVLTESRYDGNTTCSGQPSADSPDTEEWTISIGEEIIADDGNPATELDIINLTEGRTDLCIVRVEQDRFLLGCEGQGEPRATTFNEGEFVRQGPAEPRFTETFLSGQTFYLDIFEPGSSVEDSVAQITFASDGSGTVLFAPFDGNDYSTTDVNPIQWEINQQGAIEFDEFGDSTTYQTTVTPTLVGADSASADFVTVSSDGDNFTASGDLRKADATVYGFLAARSFTVDVPDSDIDRLVFNADGTGSIRFAPNPDNDFSNNDINSLQWEANGPDSLRFVEFGGDGYDREQTGCETNPDIGCGLEPYTFDLSFSSMGSDSASFSYSVTLDGSVVGSGSGTITAE